MIFLTVDEIIAIHSELIKKTGGSDGLRDKNLLESAVYSAYSAFDEVEQYPSAEEKAARFAFAITSNHAFIDGNKRIGMLVMLMTLKLNDIGISYTQRELIDLSLSAASGKAKYADVLDWIIAHKNV